MRSPPRATSVFSACAASVGLEPEPARDTHRALAFLERAAPVDNPHPIGIAERLDSIGTDHIPQVIRVPAGAAEKQLHAVGALDPRSLREQPPCPALDTCRKAVHERACRLSDLPPAEQEADPLVERTELPVPRQERA